MLLDFGVWVAGVILLLPVLILGLAWEKRRRFYKNKATNQRQITLYVVALVAASVSTLAYLGYWGWRVCGLYQIALPFIALLTLERFLWVGRLLSAVAIVCLFIGRGPYRVAVGVAILWVMLHLWTHGSIIHWT